MSIALVGNPNCGKTTLFNALTGAHQRVGNWPGVTVERKSGTLTLDSQRIEVIDLPGIYSLIQSAENSAVDECIASDFILKNEADVIVNIVDASHLERHLYLTMQLLEMGAPIILALNMMDVARAQHIEIDIPALSKALGCPVIALEARHGQGINALKQAIITFDKRLATAKKFAYSPAIQTAIDTLTRSMQSAYPTWYALRLLEGDQTIAANVSENILSDVRQQQAIISDTLGEDADILLADTRYRFIYDLLSQSLTRSTLTKTTWTERLDKIILNRFLGIPIFLGVMYLLFVFAIHVGGAFQDFFDLSSQAIFVDGFAYWLSQLGAPAWLIAILAKGVGRGINTTITFIPVLGAMFLFLAVLEDSGYMARAAFVVDRFMRMLGLPGKAFVPMIVGFGCNVPAVMGARTLENKGDRILTIMMIPFMSCGARLAIFAVFTAAFFPIGGQHIVFALYLIGVMIAILTGFLLRQTLLKGDASPLIMELPRYHFPQVKSVLLHAMQRLQAFVIRAGRLIVPICVLIGALNALNVDGSINDGEGDVNSLLSKMGLWMTPIFAPMGIQENNWPATVGLVTGVLAKEVVVGTLNSLYSQIGHFAAVASNESFQLGAALQVAWQTIPQNVMELIRPTAGSGISEPMTQGVYGLMYEKFDGKIGAFAYLLFVLLYFPCVSTMAAMLRELHRGWSVFSACWMTGVAYGAAVLFYQTATWGRHPASSSMWILAILMTFFVTILFIRGYARNSNTILNQEGVANEST